MFFICVLRKTYFIQLFLMAAFWGFWWNCSIMAAIEWNNGHKLHTLMRHMLALIPVFSKWFKVVLDAWCSYCLIHAFFCGYTEFVVNSLDQMRGKQLYPGAFAVQSSLTHSWHCKHAIITCNKRLSAAGCMATDMHGKQQNGMKKTAHFQRINAELNCTLSLLLKMYLDA